MNPERGNVARVLFGDPATGNAFTLDAAREFTARVNGAAEHANCLVIESRGALFCAGADLAMLEPFGDESMADSVRESIYDVFQGMIMAIARCPVPVIARLHGPALGLGADLALACDLKVATTEAWLEESWIRLGTISALGGAYHLTNTLGFSDALHLLLTGHRLDSTTAHARGVFQRVVTTEQLDPTVDELANTIANFDPIATRSMKTLVRPPTELDRLADALQRGLKLQVPLIARTEFGDRVRAVRDSLAQRGQN